MVSQNDGWYNAFIMCILQDKAFFVIIEHGKSAILTGATDVKLGGFYRVKYAFNEKATEANRAQHVITQYQLIEDLGPVRIETDERGIKHVLIRTTAKVVDTVSSRNKKIAKLFNDTFGHFIDVRDIVRARNKLVDFEFKCKASDHDKYLSIFIPVKVIGYYDSPTERTRHYSEQRPEYPEHRCEYRTMIGFVGSQVRADGTRFVWAENLEVDALLENRFCPRDINVCGRWVEFCVDVHSNRVVDDVKVVPDDFPSRVNRGVPEVFATFRFDGFYNRRNFNVFRHWKFGLISDPEHKIRVGSEKDEYEAWIVRERSEIPDCRWRVTATEAMGHDRNSEQECHGLDYRPDSRNRNYAVRPLESDLHRNGNVSDSGLSQNLPLRRERSSSPIDQNNDEDEYSSRSSVSRALTTDSEDGSNGGVDRPANSNYSRASSLNDVAPARRRKKTSINDSHHQFPSAIDPGDDDSEADLERSMHNGREPSPKPSGTRVTSQRFDPVSTSSNYGTPIADIDIQRPLLRPSTQTRASLESENEMLRMKVDSYHSLVRYFTDDPDTYNAMNNINSKKFRELMNLYGK